jgi:hypothetical protein
MKVKDFTPDSELGRPNYKFFSKTCYRPVLSGIVLQNIPVLLE